MKKWKKYASVLIGGACLATCATAWADTLEFTTINDGTADAYGNAESTAMTANVYRSGHSKTNPIFEFDLAGLPHNTTISSIQFNFTVHDYLFDPQHGYVTTVDFCGYAGDGQITSADYAASGELLASVTYDQVIPSKTTLHLSLDTALIQQILTNTNYLTIQLSTPNAGAYFNIDTLENWWKLPPASLSVTYTANTPAPVPEPTTLLMFGAGLIGLSALGRKK